MKQLKLLCVVAMLLLSANAVFGQQKVAVYVIGGQDAGINKVLGDQLVAAFVKSGQYTAIERTGNFLAELEKEQSYQRTGAVDDNELSRLGRQFGVQLVCVAEVNDVFGQKYVSVRLIDVESAEVLGTANTNNSMSSMNELLKVAESIAGGLTGNKTEQIQSRAIASNPCEVLQEEKPALRAIGKGTNIREQTARNIAEMQARAQFARALAAKIRTATRESVIAIDRYSEETATTEQVAKQEDFAKSVAEEIIQNTVVIKTCKELRGNQYDVWVCLEYQGDIAQMANDIAAKVEPQMADGQFKERMAKELNK